MLTKWILNCERLKTTLLLNKTRKIDLFYCFLLDFVFTIVFGLDTMSVTIYIFSMILPLFHYAAASSSIYLSSEDAQQWISFILHQSLQSLEMVSCFHGRINEKREAKKGAGLTIISIPLKRRKDAELIGLYASKCVNSVHFWIITLISSYSIYCSSAVPYIITVNHSKIDGEVIALQQVEQ